MNRELIRPCITTIGRKPRLSDQKGNRYAGYIQNTFPEPSAIAYIFSEAAPEVGASLTDNLDGEMYEVQGVQIINDRYRNYYEVCLIDTPSNTNQKSN